ncbi:MAG TPA: hypothetical protein VNE39_16565 [Planctomycetota bacterium]|nr:hypothetical protein [Planctomycetota bacterium]
MSDHEQERLFEDCLLEALLLDTLAPAARPARPRRRLAGPLLATAAALIVLTGAAVYLWPRGAVYAEPRATGDFTVASAEGKPMAQASPLRGRRVVAGKAGARLAAGGYCDVGLDPGTVVVVSGKPRSEVIEIEDGRAVCRVEPGKGEFAVLTPRGILEVVGTEFEVAVRYPGRKGETGVAQWKRTAVVTVAVLAGLVAYQFGDLAGELGPGASKVFAGEAGAGKRIVAGKATYKPKGDNPAWAEKGRIVGLVRQCPGCTIEVLDAEGKEVVLSTTVAAKGTVYELQWLKPGTYHVRVKAEGYAPLIVERLVVKAKNDLLMNIEFED